MACGCNSSAWEAEKVMSLKRLINQPSLLDELQANEKACLKRTRRIPSEE